VDAPVAGGTRQEVLEYYCNENGAREMHRFVELLNRADRTGSSSQMGFGTWEDGDMFYANTGILPRRKQAILADMLELDPNADATPLLEPFDE
jgi:hypothetical protein